MNGILKGKSFTMEALFLFTEELFKKFKMKHLFVGFKPTEVKMHNEAPI